jgi:hypothetical protein
MGEIRVLAIPETAGSERQRFARVNWKNKSVAERKARGSL